MRPLRLVLTFVLLVCAVQVRSASGQASALISPGPLARPHGALEGISNCQKCHERGRQVSVQKCLVCHTAVAQRIARRTGVHKNVKTDCVECHAEHAGVDAVLRPFDEARFDHRTVSGFTLADKHAPIAGKCAACHKTRSFLTLSRDCAACHRDTHKGGFGKTCTKCHSARTTFKEISGEFDHSKGRFRLTGAHATVGCAKCHVNNVIKGLRFSSCTSCHRDAHAPTFGANCTSCHTTAGWQTRKVSHDRTSFPLRGRHARVECTACHKKSAAEPRAGTRLMAFKNANTSCASCHRDVHLGQVGSQCDRCHDETSFTIRNYKHSGLTAAVFSAGRHGRARCSECHKRIAGAYPLGQGTAVRFAIDGRCTACHKDVHRGSLGPNCLRCHKP